MDKETYNNYVHEYSSMDGQELVDRYLIVKAVLGLKGVNLNKLDKASRKTLVKSFKQATKQ